MSSFLPDGFDEKDKKPFLSPIGSEAGNLSPEERDLWQRLSGTPADLSPEFKKWLENYVLVNIVPQIPALQIQGWSILTIPTRMTVTEFRALVPRDGQAVTITNIDGSTEWTVRYDSSVSDSYKWKFLYGTPIFARFDSSQSPGASSGVWADYANGPSKTIDQGGYYAVDIGATSGGNAAAAVSYTGFSVGGATPAFSIALPWNDGSAGYSSQSPVLVSSNSTIVKLQHNDGDATRVITSGYRFMRVWPIRIKQ